MQYFILIITLLMSVNSWGINPPTNSYPTNGATGNSTSTLLKWYTCTGATDYIYELDTSPNFNSVLHVNASIATSSYSTTYNNVSVSNLLYGTTYYWRVRAKNATDTSAYGNTWHFTTEDKVYNYYPTNGATGKSISTLLKWYTCTGATDYIYELDTSPNFNSVLHVNASIAASSYSTTHNKVRLSNLLYGTTYYWRVRAKNATDTSAYGDTWHFTTKYQLRSAPVLLSPLDLAINIPTTIQLVWDAIPNGTSYEIMYSTDSSFISGVNRTTRTQLNTTLSNLNNNTTYYWRVRGINNTGQSPWSTVWNFTTQGIGLSTFSIELEEIKIYPNPVQDLLYINLGVQGNYQLSITNLQGQMIEQHQFNGEELVYNVSKLVGGVYFIEIRTKGKNKSFKFIKS